MSEELIKDCYGRIIAKVDNQPNGDKIVKNCYGQILGKYDKTIDATKDFYGRIVAKGDCVGILIK